ncbi:MAG TPA: RND transporter [Gammaproteobacteria bacterium]|nr:RND transporter [Gammaproteobacteria bacterium]
MDNQKDNSLILFSVNHPKVIAWSMGLATLLLILLALLPSLWPATFAQLNPLAVDTDPENMLAKEAPVRVFHNKMKRTFSLSDMVVVGVVNNQDPNGVFNPDSLKRIYKLTEFAKTLTWPDPKNPDKSAGVIEIDMLAPSEVDNIEQGGPGIVNFSWLMEKPPETQAQALLIRDRALRIPLLHDTLVSNDGKALAIYLPLTEKHYSYQVREALIEEINRWPSADDEYHITGLPVAEDTFGVEMFIQMAISAPLAMLLIFLLLWFFFKKLVLVVSPMIVAMVCAISTMALLIISGNTIHIMSSMIPIFIMPIAVLDAIHILSDFFDEYPKHRDRKKALLTVMRHLYSPMLFTTLTTMAGFASLALTPIPPVQVFGLFIAFGVFLAWFWTITFIPAFIMFIPEEKLSNFGHKITDESQQDNTPLSKALSSLGKITFRHARLILAGTAASVVIAGYGISQININDNPIKWFSANHPIRIADNVLNEHFGGTYMAYLALEPKQSSITNNDASVLKRLEAQQQIAMNEGIENVPEVFSKIRDRIKNSTDAMPRQSLQNFVEQALENASDETYDAWDSAMELLDKMREEKQIFTQPEALNYIAKLQTYLASLDTVGKSSSIADIVKTVHRELLSGDESAFRIPDRSNAVAQTLLTYQNSHRPQDLWHFVTPDYKKTVIMVQLTSGDNQDMAKVEQAVKKYIEENPLPFNLTQRWFGLTYINVVWQDEMVSGMLEAFAGSFIIVMLMMIFLFRSITWGILSMVPLTITVGFIYGVVGIIGKDYDMPVAVLSALSLGLAIDYAIHFLARARQIHAATGNWQDSVAPMFAEPARAITRNAIVVGVGFLPLLAAPLVPYQTVGIFIASILVLAGIASLLILPAIITLMEKHLFKQVIPEP